MCSAAFGFEMFIRVEFRLCEWRCIKAVSYLICLNAYMRSSLVLWVVLCRPCGLLMSAVVASSIVWSRCLLHRLHRLSSLQEGVANIFLALIFQQRRVSRWYWRFFRMLVPIILGVLRFINNVFRIANTSLLQVLAYCASIFVKLRSAASTIASARSRCRLL